MGQSRQRSELGFEAKEGTRIETRKKLHCEARTARGIVGPEDRTGGTSTELCLQPEPVGDQLTDPRHGQPHGRIG